MVLFPNAKINIGLNILRERSDGYHDIETLFYPIGLKESLEIILNEKNEIVFGNSGLQMDIESEQNIVLKAYRLLAKDYNLPGLRIHLHKVIPFGAGLGGGSADAAFFLKGINELCKLGLNVEQLKNYAGKLGADCQFFVENRVAYATGTGDCLTPVEISLKEYHLLLVKPPVGVSTAMAYAGVKPQNYSYPFVEKLKEGPELWSSYIKNDFETTVFEKFPEIKCIKKQLLNMGALYASMSGSGSSVYGIFKSEPIVPEALFPNDAFIWKEKF